ncbi:MAG TPA: hypothetical protein VHI13_02825 [Candidatus Kapabacteria bacterium]|nr:hypothetical protein [Candidatus Kapabacteria bacterium]
MMEPLKKILATLEQRLATASDADKATLTEQIAEIKAAIAEAGAPAPAPVPPTIHGTPDIAAAVAQGVQSAMAPFTERMQAVEKLFLQERQAREATQAELAAQTKAKRESEIRELLDKGIQEGRLTAEERDQWQKDLEASYDVSKRALERIPVNPATARGKTQQAGQQTGVTAANPAAKAAVAQATDGVSRAARPDALKYVQDQVPV